MKPPRLDLPSSKSMRIPVPRAFFPNLDSNGRDIPLLIPGTSIPVPDILLLATNGAEFSLLAVLASSQIRIAGFCPYVPSQPRFSLSHFIPPYGSRASSSRQILSSSSQSTPFLRRELIRSSDAVVCFSRLNTSCYKKLAVLVKEIEAQEMKEQSRLRRKMKRNPNIEKSVKQLEKGGLLKLGNMKEHSSKTSNCSSSQLNESSLNQSYESEELGSSVVISNNREFLALNPLVPTQEATLRLRHFASRRGLRRTIFIAVEEESKHPGTALFALNVLFGAFGIELPLINK